MFSQEELKRIVKKKAKKKSNYIEKGVVYLDFIAFYVAGDFRITAKLKNTDFRDYRNLKNQINKEFKIAKKVRKEMKKFLKEELKKNDEEGNS